MMVERIIERLKVEQIWHDLCEADKSKNLDHIIDHFSDDIIYHVSGFPPMEGKDAIRDFIQAELLDDLKWGIDRTEVSESGDLAYSSVWFKMKWSGSDVYSEWKGILVYRKVNGVWKIVVESYSINSEEGRAF